jgi:hypothetical protein
MMMIRILFRRCAAIWEAIAHEAGHTFGLRWVQNLGCLGCVLPCFSLSTAYTLLPCLPVHPHRVIYTTCEPPSIVCSHHGRIASDTNEAEEYYQVTWGSNAIISPISGTVTCLCSYFLKHMP